jgi:hypothetical protein
LPTFVAVLEPVAVGAASAASFSLQLLGCFLKLLPPPLVRQISKHPPHHSNSRCVQEGRSVLGGVFDDPLLLLQHYSNSKDEQERKKKSSKPPTTEEEAHGVVVVVVLVVMKLAVDDVFMSVRSSL